MITIKEFADKVSAVPFVSKGRDFSGFDCWGLVKAAYKEVNNIELDDFLDDYSTAQDVRRISRTMLANGARQLWEPIKESCVQPMDIIVLRLKSVPCHVGLVLDKRYFLHTIDAIGVCFERWNASPWRHGTMDKVYGFYRYVQRGD